MIILTVLHLDPLIHRTYVAKQRKAATPSYALFPWLAFAVPIAAAHLNTPRLKHCHPIHLPRKVPSEDTGPCNGLLIERSGEFVPPNLKFSPFGASFYSCSLVKVSKIGSRSKSLHIGCESFDGNTRNAIKEDESIQKLERKHTARRIDVEISLLDG